MAKRRSIFGTKPHVRQVHGLTAAGRQVEIADKRAMQALIKRVQGEWKDHAWTYYDLIGEAKEAGRFLSNCMGRIRFYVADVPDDDAKVPEATADKAAAKAWGRIGRHSALQKKFGANAFVTGDGFLIGIMPREDGDGERWVYASTREVTKKGDKYIYNDAEKKIELRKEDFFARIWIEHAADAGDSDSSMRGVLSACDTLVAIDQTVRAIIRQRAASGSIIAIPDDVTVGQVDTSQSQGEEDEDDVIDAVVDAFITPSENPGSAGSVAPIVITYPRRQMTDKSGIEIHRIDRPLDDMFDKITDRALRRFAQGSNVNVERIFGLGEANHWGAGQIEESDYRDHVEPVAEVWADGLTDAFLRPELKRMKHPNPEKLMVWFDPSALVVRSDRQEARDFGVVHGLIKDDTWRDDAGYDDSDAPSDEEIARRIEIEQALKSGKPQEPAITAAGRSVQRGAARNGAGPKARQPG